MTKNGIEKFINQDTGRISTRIKSFTDLSIEKLYCIYNDIEINEVLEFKSFTMGYINKFKKDFILTKREDLLKYKHILIMKNGRLDSNKLCQVQFSVKQIYDIIYKKGICANSKCGKETKFISFPKGYSRTCEHCNNVAGGIIAREKSIKTCEEKYGETDPMKAQEIIDKKIQSMTIDGIYNNNFKKAKQTELEKYGMNFQLTDAFIKGREKTCIEKYGTYNPFRVEKFIKEIQKSRKETMIKEGKWLSDKERPLIDIYHKEVIKHTSRNYKNIPNIEKRGRREINPNAFELDHKYSIKEGYINKIPPYIIGSICNLEMLHWKENVAKGAKCSMTKQELFKAFDKSRSI